MAPGAKILYVGSADCQDPALDTALNWVVSNHAAQIVSNSYGNTGEDVSPQELAIFHQIVVDAADEGIGIYFSSGDDGDEASTLPKPSPDFPASDPFVTAVGGTSLGVGSNGSTVLETGWETGKSVLVGNRYRPAAPGKFLYGSGGGTSRLFAEPAYQIGVVPDALALKNHNRGATGRVVPDISLDGDPTTGMLVGQTQTFPDGVYYDQYRIGGTSLSCPLMAGLMALADHAAGGAHGFVNPVLYADLAGTSAVTDVQHVTAAAARVDFNNAVDATAGTTTTVRTMDFAGLYIATRSGYDDVTGLGTPNGVAFIDAL
jgi:subtilase family serine protease